METDIVELRNEIKKLKNEIQDLSIRVSSLESQHQTYGPICGENSYWRPDKCIIGDSFGEGWDQPISPGPGRHGDW